MLCQSVRELENIVERAVVITRGFLLTLEDLPFQEALCASSTETDDEQSREGSLLLAVENLEREMIRDALEKAAFNQSQAAKLLGISKRMLRYKLEKYGLK